MPPVSRTDPQPTRKPGFGPALLHWLPLWGPTTAVMGGVIAYVAKHGRETGIVMLFVRTDWVTQVVLAAAAVIFAALLVVRYRGPAHPLGFALALGARSFLRGIPLVLLAVTGLWLLGSFVRVRYELFSQTWFQERAIDQALDGDVARAARICYRYLDLYPQRQAGRALPDPVCLGITGDVRKVKQLYEFIRRSPTPNVFRPLPDTTFAFSTRTEARRLLEWSTRVSPRPEPPRRSE
jgi:hypothetical protein